MVRPLALVIAGAAALAVSGCAYDYLQRTDKVGYSAGDAVKANIAAQTTDPAKDTAYTTKGLGKNGEVKPTTGDAPSAE
jgi:hypothetical protein